MSMYPNQGARGWELDPAAGAGSRTAVTVQFFNTVYAWMCVGLGVTAMVAWHVSRNEALMELLYGSGRGVAVAFLLGAAVLAFAVQAAAHKISPLVATLLFLVYASLIGAFISYIFVIYSLGTLGAAFLMTAGTFGVMSLYGFVTKRDLTTIGSFLVMAMVGLFLASLVNIFMASDAMSWVITYAVLGVFMGLTAYDTQKLKQIALATADDPKMAARYAIVGSLLLYIAFINMFMSILRILGSRK